MHPPVVGTGDHRSRVKRKGRESLCGGPCEDRPRYHGVWRYAFLTLFVCVCGTGLTELTAVVRNNSKFDVCR